MTYAEIVERKMNELTTGKNEEYVKEVRKNLEDLYNNRERGIFVDGADSKESQRIEGFKKREISRVKHIRIPGKRRAPY